MDNPPFDDLECAYEYLQLLREQVESTRTDIEGDVANAVAIEAHRRLDALRLVDYKLQQLGTHLTASRAIVNDLRMLRRLLASGEPPAATAAGERPADGPAPTGRA